MIMAPRVRKALLTIHVTLSLGWIGAVAAFLALVLGAMASSDSDSLRGAWFAMNWIGWYAIVPLAISALLTGLVMALGTKWGLLRHYWVLVSLVLTVGATAILLGNMQTVTFYAAQAAAGADEAALREGLPSELLHAGLGLMVLLVVNVLNVYKPAGMTRYGLRRSQTERPS